MAGIRRHGLGLRDQRPVPGSTVFDRSGSPQPLPGLLASHQARWCGLTPVAKAQLAASPYLLADAGFDDEQRWLWPGRRMVRDLRRDLRRHSSSASTSATSCVGCWCSVGTWRGLTGSWLAGARHDAGLRRARGRAAATRPRLAAEHQPGWVRPRWERRAGHVARPAACRRWR